MIGDLPIMTRKNFERYLEEKSKTPASGTPHGIWPIRSVWFDRGMYNPEQALEVY